MGGREDRTIGRGGGSVLGIDDTVEDEALVLREG